ncbi:513_t:CDS:1, partial [Ambispora leptoticha]
EILAKLGLIGLRFGKEKNNNKNLPATQAKNNDKKTAEKISINNKKDGIIREERK